MANLVLEYVPKVLAFYPPRFQKQIPPYLWKYIPKFLALKSYYTFYNSIYMIL